MRSPLILALCGLLAACGENPTTEAGKPPAPNVTKIDCKAVKPGKAPPGQPVDDVLGVRPGMTFDEANSVLRCANAAYRFEENQAGFSLAALPDGRAPKLSFIARAGKVAGCDPNDASTLSICVDEHPTFERIDDAVQVLFTGPPGQEKVIVVGRTISYPEGGERDVQGLVADLKAKYGPGVVQTASYGTTGYLSWVFDSAGQSLTQANPDLAECANVVGHGSITPSQIREGCNLTINATLSLKSDNPGLVDGLTIVAVNQAAANRQIEAARSAIAALTEQARAQEVERARTSGAGARL